MPKALLALCVLAIPLILASCRVEEKETVIRASSTNAPAWTTQKWSVGGDEMVRFTSIADGGSEKNARMKAETAMSIKYLEYIVPVTRAHYSLVRSELPSIQKAVDSYLELTLSSLASNRQTAGLVLEDVFWQEIGLGTNRYYRVYLLYAQALKMHTAVLSSIAAEIRDSGDTNRFIDGDAIITALESTSGRMAGLKE